MPIARFTRDNASLLVIDLQEKLVPVIHDHERVVNQCSTLIQGAQLLGVPIQMTEQYPKGLGSTISAIRELFPKETVVHEKTKFSACVDPVIGALRASQRRNVVLCGIESHVCVLQTALDLSQAGFIVGVPTDAISSRDAGDHLAGVERMQQTGIVTLSVEMLLMEWLKEAGTPEFKAVLPLIK